MVLFSVNFGWNVQFAVDQQTLRSLVVNDKSIADLTALEIGNVGENIAVRRAMFLRATTEKHLIASYVHSTGIFYFLLLIMSCAGKFYILIVYKLIAIVLQVDLRITVLKENDPTRV